MTLAAAIEAALPGFRAEANATFTDTFTAESFELTKDADDLDVESWAFEYETPGKIPNKVSSGDASNARTVTIGGVERLVIEEGLHLPWSTTPVLVGMEYELTTLGPTTHPSMLGKRFQVVETHMTSATTAWRLDVVDVTPVEES